ncbi:MAG: hypothetical protein Tsb009_23900 [Planctomycetaceae bacterium]
MKLPLTNQNDCLPKASQRTSTVVLMTLLTVLTAGCASMRPPSRVTGDEEFFKGHRESAKPLSRENRGNPSTKDSDNTPPPSTVVPNNGPTIPDGSGTSLPKLNLDVKISQQLQVGNPATFRLTLQNPGTKPVEQITVQAQFDKPLVFPGHPDSLPRQTVGTLQPGQKQELTLTLTCDKPGKHCCGFSVRSGQQEILWKSVCVNFIPRQLDVSVTVPSVRSVGGKAEATLLISNVGKTDLKNLNVETTFSESDFKPVELTAGAAREPGKVSWSFASLKAGEALPLQLELECLKPSEKTCLNVAVKAKSFPETTVTGCLKIEAPTRSWVMRIADTADILNVGENTAVLISIQNQTGMRAKPGPVVVDIPSNFRVISTSVWQGENQLAVKAVTKDSRVTFTAPAVMVDLQGDLTYRVRVKAVQPAVGHFRATLQQADGTPVVSREEPIHVNP